MLNTFLIIDSLIACFWTYCKNS